MPQNNAIRVSRKDLLRAAIFVAGSILVMAGCASAGAAGPNTEFAAYAVALGNCDCTGTTYICTNQDGTVRRFDESYFCSQQDLNRAGVCACEGTTLACTYQICTYDQGLYKVYAACDSAGYNAHQDTAKGTSSGYVIKHLFANSPLCEGAVTEAPTFTPAATPQDAPTSGPTSTP